MASLYSASNVNQVGQPRDAARSTASDGSSNAIGMAVIEVAPNAVEMARADAAPPRGVVRVWGRVSCSVVRRHTNLSALALAGCAVLFGFGCSSDETPPAQSSTGGSATANAGAGGGGQTAQGGTNGSSGGSGGTANAGAAGDPGAGGTAPAGDPTTPLSANQCTGIGNGDPCPTPGTCAGRVCGLADLGSRDCVCTGGAWDCTSCAYPMGPNQPSVLVPPGTGDAGALRTCEGTVSGEGDVPCSPMGDRCQLGTEVCACWIIEDGMTIWDCDNPPSFWTAAP